MNNENIVIDEIIKDIERYNVMKNIYNIKNKVNIYECTMVLFLEFVVINIGVILVGSAFLFVDYFYFNNFDITNLIMITVSLFLPFLFMYCLNFICEYGSRFISVYYLFNKKYKYHMFKNQTVSKQEIKKIKNGIYKKLDKLNMTEIKKNRLLKKYEFIDLYLAEKEKNKIELINHFLNSKEIINLTEEELSKKLEITKNIKKIEKSIIND